MDTNHKTIDNKTRGEVGALFQGYVVQPLTEELQTKLEKAASDENDQFEVVKEELGTVKLAVKLTDSSVKKTVKEETGASKTAIMDELETLQKSITGGVTAARNTITKQMQTDNEAAAQTNQTLLQEMEKTQQEIETAKIIIQGELRRQGENSYETIEEGFAGTDKKMDDNFRQFGDLVRTDKGVHLRKQGGQFLPEALGQAARHDEFLVFRISPVFPGTHDVQNGIDGFLLGLVNESAGIDHHYVREFRFRSHGHAGFLQVADHDFRVNQILGAAQGNESNGERHGSR